MAWGWIAALVGAAVYGYACMAGAVYGLKREVSPCKDYGDDVCFAVLWPLAVPFTLMLVVAEGSYSLTTHLLERRKVAALPEARVAR